MEDKGLFESTEIVHDQVAENLEADAREREADRRERQMAGTRFDVMLNAQAGVQAQALLRGQHDPGAKRWERLKNELYVGFKNVICYAQIPPGPNRIENYDKEN